MKKVINEITEYSAKNQSIKLKFEAFENSMIKYLRGERFFFWEIDLFKFEFGISYIDIIERVILSPEKSKSKINS